jgi:hypothetical protein
MDLLNKKRRASVKRSVKEKVAEAVIETVQRPDVDSSVNAASEITEAVTDNVLPQVVHATNSEPWYQSRVTIGAIIIILSRLLAHFGYAIPEELHGAVLDLIIAFGPYIGAVFALWGRWVARKPLGS